MKQSTLNFIFWITILLILLVPLFLIGENPGLYFDAINPDYVAVQILNPQEYQVRWFVAYPILVQIYHGSVNILVSLLALFLTGETSVVQHHVVNGVITYICLLLVDKIAVQYKTRVLSRYSVILILASMPTLLTITMTQYYIELPGTVMILIAAFIYFKAYSMNSDKNQILAFTMVFFFLGFSFYSYFNFLFFTPGFMFLYIISGKDNLEKIRNFLVSLYGFSFGASLYFIGFIMIHLTRIGRGNVSNITGIATFALVYSFLLYLLWLLWKDKTKLAIHISMCLGIIVFLIMIEILPSVALIAKQLNVIGTNTDIYNRVLIVIKNVYNALTGISAENLIYGSIVNQFQHFNILYIYFLTFTWVYLFSFKRYVRNSYIIAQYINVLISYLVLSLFFASRMQTQHFIPMIFWIAILAILILDIVIEALYEKFKNFKPIKYVGLVFLIFLITLNSLDKYKIMKNILSTGGTKLFTNQINELSSEALRKYENGEKEVYLFPEWGFMTGFSFLTQNKVAMTTSIDLELIESFLNKDYDIVLVYWDNKNTEIYVNLLSTLDLGEIIVSEYFQNNGDVVFYKLSIDTN